MIILSIICLLVGSLIPISDSFINTKGFNDVLDRSDFSARKVKTKVSQENNRTLPVEPPLFIGSFNIQTLVKKKFNDGFVMEIVEKVVLRYDLILLLEIHTNTDLYMEKLLRDVNLAVPPNEKYGMVLSHRQNQTTEHYAFLYKKNKLKVITSESYNEPRVFYRKPLVAIFEAFTLRDMKKFGVIGQHVKPSNAVQELNGLADLYDYVRYKYDIEDVLLMGDFNADCTYVKESDWDNISLWYRSEFTWAITSNMDTTTNYKSCALDRFVYAGEKMNEGIILSSAGAFNFQEEFELTVKEARSVSDHLPIEIKIRGKMSNVAEKYLNPEVCFHIQDSQPRANVSSSKIFNQAKRISFNANKTSDGILLNNKIKGEEEDMLDAFSSLRTSLPKVVSQELAEAVNYKVKHGSLKDDSSFADVSESVYTIKVLLSHEFTEAVICRSTTVN